MPSKFTTFIRGLLPVLRRAAPGAIALWVPVLIFTAIANEVAEREPLPFDAPVLNFLHSFATPLLDNIALATTHFGGLIFIVIATVVLAALSYRYVSQRAAYFAIIAGGGSAAMNFLIKSLFQRQRPDLWQAIVTEKTFSFPSGHSMASSALAFSVMAIFWNTRWRWLAVSLSTIYFAYIGLTRVYLGVHFPSDVLAGWCISLIWVLLVGAAITPVKMPNKF